MMTSRVRHDEANENLKSPPFSAGLEKAHQSNDTLYR